MGGIEVKLLRDTEGGGDPAQPGEIAAMMADFIDGASESLDVAVYDFRLLTDALANPVVGALQAAAGREPSVKIRIAFDAGKPPEQKPLQFEAHGADMAPIGTTAWLERELGPVQGLELKPITSPEGHLMHSKYIVRDRTSEHAAVWMGSANFTDAAWSRQENNIVRLTSGPLAEAYGVDFDELWKEGNIESTGQGDIGQTVIDELPIGWKFSPGEGRQIDEGLVAAVTGANARIRIASMVLTSRSVLKALVAAIEDKKDLASIYDGGQMDHIETYDWIPKNSPSLPLWERVKAHLIKKPTPEYAENGPHNIMHNKVLVVDDQVLTGSHNFSANAEGNAENQLEIDDRGLADAYAKYIEHLVDQYSA